MKYFATAFVTAVVVFMIATLYYKGLPNFSRPSGVSDVAREEEFLEEEASPAPIDEESILAEIIKDELIEKYGTQSAGISISVSKVEGEYAKGMVTEEGGGGMWFAARLNGNWTLVWDGNGQIDCKDISPFPEFPKDMIPECWDSSSSAIITR